MKKIIQIKGGLGNQLFQYAHGRMLQLSGVNVIFDTSFYNKNIGDTNRVFNLKVFNINEKSVFEDRRNFLSGFNILNKIIIRLGLKNNGYWQSEKYFINIKEVIIKEITLKSKPTNRYLKIREQIDSVLNSISIHVRRGDYVYDNKTNIYHGTCSSEYYFKALECVTSKIGKNINVFIFSDDIEWVKQNIPIPYPATYVSDPSNIPDFEELILMSKCKHNIISNSTFSWWGAWLNQNKDKIVIAPKRWVLKNQRMFRDIVPKDWIRI